MARQQFPDSLAKLVQEWCSVEQISDLLRNAKYIRDEVRVSAPKKEILVDQNLREAVETEAVSLDAVYNLIREAEENGNQHIFYYKHGLDGVLTLDQVGSKLFGAEWRQTKGFPRTDLVEQEFVFADLHPWNVHLKPNDWILKIYGHEFTERPTGVVEEVGDNKLKREFVREERRIVVVVRWNNSCRLLEVRVPQTESKKRINVWLKRTWEMISGACHPGEYLQWNLKRQRKRIIDEEKTNQKIYGNYPLTVGIISGHIDRRFGDGDRYYLTPPKDIDMRVPDGIRKTALFIGIKEDPDNPTWCATGYFLSVPQSVISALPLPQTKAGRFFETHHLPFKFLATAAHVAKELEGNEFALRVNKKDGGVAIIHGNAYTRWWYHPTDKEHVDAAVTLFPPDEIGTFDIGTISLNLFADESRITELNIGPGDEIFIAGLFKKITKTAQNVPIVRMGNLAMMPGERVPFGRGMIDAYLVESRSIGGLSGSPVFVRETIQISGLPPGVMVNSRHHVPPRDLQVVMSGIGRFYFLGSMIGHWEEATGLNVPQQEAVNMGISPVVPAQKIKEIITQPGVLDMVNKLTEELESKKKDTVFDIDSDSGSEKKQPFTREDFEDALKRVSRKISDQK